MEQVKIVDEELVHKSHALAVDQKCLEYRAKLQPDIQIEPEIK